MTSKANGPSVEDMEERIFRKEFKKMDKKKSGTLPQELLSEFLVKVAVFIPEEELPSILNEMGVVGNEDIEFNQLLIWFKEYNVKMNGYGDMDGGDEDEEDEPVKKSNGGGLKKLFSRSQSQSAPNSTAVKQESMPAEEATAASEKKKGKGGVKEEEEEED